MQTFGEAIWLAAYLVQMAALAAGIGLASIIASSALWEVIRRTVGERRHEESKSLAGPKVGSVGGSTVYWRL